MTLIASEFIAAPPAPESRGDAELVALLFGAGRAGPQAIDDARLLLLRCGSLQKLLSLDNCAASALSGYGARRHTLLRAALELARRHYLAEISSGPMLDSPQATRSFLISRLRDLPHELFCMLTLDNRQRLNAFDELFRGTIDGASVHPREVVRQALARNASAVILAHNHPSGIAEPSQADELITQRLKDALGLMDIRVLDHLVVGGARCVSFVERGLL
ncbi:MAG: DNA repair protein RadC [Nevskiaceae bacterium]|nr:DNA repair protein RadC [Nevskiaceae bacterium]